jgi:hypothetical protein
MRPLLVSLKPAKGGICLKSAHGEQVIQFQRFPRWMWRNEEVPRFVERLRDINMTRQANDRVGFYGPDTHEVVLLACAPCCPYAGETSSSERMNRRLAISTSNR